MKHLTVLDTRENSRDYQRGGCRIYSFLLNQGWLCLASADMSEVHKTPRSAGFQRSRPRHTMEIASQCPPCPTAVGSASSFHEARGCGNGKKNGNHKYKWKSITERNQFMKCCYFAELAVAC